jgi:ribosomal protein S18 acetylase RimI-like enzyme
VDLLRTDTRPQVRLRPWPGQPDVVQLVLRNHLSVPNRDDVNGRTAACAAKGGRSIRTGALFPSAAEAFLHAGFSPVDRLALLELDLADSQPDDRAFRLSRTWRLTARQLTDAARLDQRAFAAPWGNDRSSLRDIQSATPRVRSRCVRTGEGIHAFAISGRAGARGYIQRLAVDPSSQRRGLGRTLLVDAVRWLGRHRCTSAWVNTGIDNAPALGLYESIGFTRRAEQLVVLESAPLT